MKTRALIGCFLLFSLTAFHAPADGPIPENWLTVAERTGFEATASHAETMAMLESLAEASPLIELTSFGRSAEGRDLPLVVVSKDRLFTPEEAHAAGVPVLLFQSCIHPGEVAGKTASLMILRDLALGKRKELLEAGVILFAPIYNADGHEKVSPLNRANQDGPVRGMGFRTTTAGLDLNRDHMKIDSPEARALVDLLNRWDPHLHVDNHVTNGSRHRWVLTWSTAEAPQLAPSLDAWLADNLPQALAATEKAGWPTGPYVSLIDRSDPSAGIDSSVAGPRYSTGYLALRNRISILVEMYAYATFEDRVRANREFLEQLALQVAREPESLIAATEAADEGTVAKGRADAKASPTVLRWKTAAGDDTVAFPVCSWESRPSVVIGHPLIHFECRPDDPVLEVPWRHRPEEVATTPRPRGYLVAPGWPQIEQRLEAHGLTLFRLEEETDLEVGTFRLSGLELAGRSYQGRVQVESVDVEKALDRRTLPAGTVWIPADQPLFELAVQLLEPEAPDSLLRWGMMHSVVERKEYIGMTKLENLTAELLKDPAIREAWERALEDPDLAKNTRARYIWWYSHTDYWDEGVGLMPVFRLPEAAEFAVRPW